MSVSVAARALERSDTAVTAVQSINAAAKVVAKAIRMTNRALMLEPNDPDAIALQGEAMVELGATARAQQNLQKLQSICAPRGCPQAAQLSAAIARGPTVAQAKAPEVPKKN